MSLIGAEEVSVSRATEQRVKVHCVDPRPIKDQRNGLNELLTGAVQEPVANLIRILPGSSERRLKLLFAALVVLLKLPQRCGGRFNV